MNAKEIQIDGTEISVTTEQTSEFPPAFNLVATHPNGATHSSSLTLGDADLTNIVTLQDAQSFLDAARLDCATMAGKKAALSALAAQIQ